MKKHLLQVVIVISCVLSLTTLFAQDNTSSSTQYKAYNNYDFRAGEKIIFEDDFSGDRDGEFPGHWDLLSGQAVVNKVLDVPALLITEGNYGKVFPRMKSKQYLPAEFTLEFDHTMQSVNKGYGLGLFLVNADGAEAKLMFNENAVSYTSKSKNINTQLPDDIRAKKYLDKWNHIAIAYRNNQMKVYVNQFRVVVVPNMDFAPVAVRFGGIGSQKSPLVFTSIKIAEGGDMNMLQKITTDGRLVVHGIKFDYNKAVIKPESMGVINDIAKLLRENPAMKFEIQGHTDSDGGDEYNMKLSQARADAVKAMLVEAGIDGAGLTAKGYGKSKPIADNVTPEGKANNRRVEFVKM
jgi:OOP family OmpA-OmpF porin